MLLDDANGEAYGSSGRRGDSGWFFSLDETIRGDLRLVGSTVTVVIRVLEVEC